MEGFLKKLKTWRFLRLVWYLTSCCLEQGLGKGSLTVFLTKSRSDVSEQLRQCTSDNQTFPGRPGNAFDSKS